MHTLVTKNEYDDACNVKHCISHQKFAMQVIEQVIIMDFVYILNWLGKVKKQTVLNSIVQLN